MYSLTWLADVLRAAGCNVVETPGWKNRGRAEMGTVLGVLEHHTGPGSDTAMLGLIQNGRPDLAGPLAHLFLDRNATFHVMAAGRCNHAGAGQWHGITDGNGHLVGIEVANDGDGKDPWPPAQLAALALGTAAILEHVGADPVMAAGHKEYALPRGRKIDPTFDMVAFRDRLEAIMAADESEVLPSVQPTDPRRAMLRKGDQGNSVRQLQTLLGIAADGGFGPKTEAAVKAFQTSRGLKADGLVGPATWKALGH